jgi:hypothetical protein
MPKFAFASLLAVALVGTTVSNPSVAETRHKHVEKADAARDRAAPGHNAYGMPGSYYPAPPFPFFLLPGPWWLPAHP